MTHQTQIETREKKPTFLKGLAFIVLLAIVSAGLMFLALTRRSVDGPLIPENTPAAISVQVEEVQLADALTLEEAFSGIVSARRTSQLGFSGSGRVTRIRADVGDAVNAGEVLAQLDTRDLRASLAAAEATIAEAEANYALADNTVERQRTLFERGHVAQQRVDEAEAQAGASQARIEAAKARADALRVAIDLSTIRAPYAGTITVRMMDEGAIATPGMAMLEIVEAGQLEARIGVPSTVAANMDIGEVYTLTSDRGPVEAKLRAKTGVIDQSLRTMSTVFDIVDASAVDAGAVVRLAMPREIAERGFWAPVSALAESSRGLWSMYVAEPVGTGYEARPRLVEVVHSDGDRVFVRGTLNDGERYIAGGIARLVPGQRVEPRLVSSAINTSGAE